MEYLASAERGKLKVKTLYCCWKTWMAGLRGSKAERAAVGSVAWSPLKPKCMISIAIPAAKHQGHWGSPPRAGSFVCTPWFSGVWKGLQAALRVRSAELAVLALERRQDLDVCSALKARRVPGSGRMSILCRVTIVRGMNGRVCLGALSHLTQLCVSRRDTSKNCSVLYRPQQIGSESSARGNSSPRDRDAAAHDVLGLCFPAGMGTRVQLFLSLLVRVGRQLS